MPLQLVACQIFLDAILDAVFVEIAIGGVRVAQRYRGGARTLPALAGVSSRAPDKPHHTAHPRQPGVRVIVDRWVLQLVQDFIDSTQPGQVRAFIEEAVVTYIDQLAATGPVDPRLWHD